MSQDEDGMRGRAGQVSWGLAHSVPPVARWVAPFGSQREVAFSHSRHCV